MIGLDRRGVTLLELLIVLTLMGVLAGMSALMLGGPPPAAPSRSALDRAARRAVLSGRRIVLPGPDSSATRSAALLPDGRIIGEGLDPVRGVAW